MRRIKQWILEPGSAWKESIQLILIRCVLWLMLAMIAAIIYATVMVIR